MTGRDIAIVAAGVPQPVLGTSASTPMFASMVALVNDQLLNAGLRPLGFLNPLLYSAGAAGVFNDIVVGNNPGCGSDGFPALPGWDPVCPSSCSLAGWPRKGCSDVGPGLVRSLAWAPLTSIVFWRSRRRAVLISGRGSEAWTQLAVYPRFERD